jgi:hypothetical protein
MVILVMGGENVEELIKMRNCFNELANLTSKMIELKLREAAGEDVQKEFNTVQLKLVSKMMELE